MPRRPLLVANNDWWLEESKVDLIAPYWAEVGLRVAERVLHDHMGMAKPAWLAKAWYDANVMEVKGAMPPTNKTYNSDFAYIFAAVEAQ